nr:hypothetical protein [uncultured Flavobacterium sp.]
MKKILFTLFISTTTFLGFGQGNTRTQELGKYEGLSMTPPMGWNSWNTFGTNIDEKLVKETADRRIQVSIAIFCFRVLPYFSNSESQILIVLRLSKFKK